MTRAARLGLVLVALAACGLRITVHGERSKIATFLRYGTYAWASPPTPARSPGETAGALLDWRVRSAADRALAGKRYVRTEGAASLLVDWDVATAGWRSGGLRDYLRARRPLGGDFARGYEDGTLVLHLVDARTGELAYRAWATRALAEGDPPPHPDELVVRMLADLPPATE